MTKTADDLVTAVKRRGSIVSAQVLLLDSDMLALADEVISLHLVPLLMRTAQDFFVTTTTTSLVAAQTDYDIPYRAIGRTVRDIKVLDSTGDTICDLPMVDIEEEHLYQSVAAPYAGYFKGDKLVIRPTPATGVTDVLKFWYPLKPSKLVLLADAAVVASTTSTTVVVSTIPATFVTGETFDFIQAESGNSIMGMDKTCTTVSSTTITFASGDIPTDLAAGDYVALDGQSPVIMLPDEAFPLLVTQTLQWCLNAKGDLEGANSLEALRKEQEKNLIDMVQPRQKGEVRPVVNQYGLLRGRRSAFRGLFR